MLSLWHWLMKKQNNYKIIFFISEERLSNKIWYFRKLDVILAYMNEDYENYVLILILLCNNVFTLRSVTPSPYLPFLRPWGQFGWLEGGRGMGGGMIIIIKWEEMEERGLAEHKKVCNKETLHNLLLKTVRNMQLQAWFYSPHCMSVFDMPIL